MKKIGKKLILIPMMVAALVVSAVIGCIPVVQVQAAGKTAEGLVAHVQNAYSRGATYVYGATGPNSYDCSGLIYAYAGGARVSESMIASCPESGSASSIPEIPGLILWRPGHVGVYVGNGMAIDARSSNAGIRYEPVAGKWTKWGKLPTLSYSGSPVYTTPTAPTTQTPSGKQTANTGSKAAVQAPTYTDLGLAAQGGAVTRLQTRLIELGYYYEGVNDYYDSCLGDAVTAFQKANNLEATGAADVKTQQTAFSSSAVANATPGTIMPGLHSSIVRVMQERLTELGYFNDETSGFYGDVTKAAVMAYQERSGVEATGILNGEALERLYSDEAVRAPEPEVPSSEPEPSSIASSEASSEIGASSGNVQVFDDILPTVAAAEKAGLESGNTSSGSGTVAFLLVLLCLFLTGAFFVARKYGKNIRTFSVALVKEISKKDLFRFLKK